MADKCIGKLTLDISDVNKKIEDVNKFLSQIGANINLEDTLSKKISSALRNLVDEAKKAGEEAARAIQAGTSSTGNGSTENLKNAIKLWREYYSVLAQAENALKGGNTDRFNDLRREADEIRKRASALREEKDVLDETAAARRRYETAYSNRVQKDQMKEEAENAKALSYAIKEATEAKKREEKATDEAARAAQREIQEREKLTQMYRQLFDQADERDAKALDNYRMQQVKDEQEALNNLIAKYQEYFNWKTKAVNADANGNKASADLYTKNAHEAYDEIQRLIGLRPELQKVAEDSEKVKKAMTEWSNAINVSNMKQAADSTKEYNQSIENYAKALTSYFTAFSNLQRQIASGKIEVGSDSYKAAVEDIKRLKEEAQRAGETLDHTGKQAAAGMQNVQNAVGELSKSVAVMDDALAKADEKSNKQFGIEQLERAKHAYFELTDAIKNYNISKNENDSKGMATAQARVDAAMQEVNAIKDVVANSQIEANTKQQILDYLQRIVTTQRQHSSETGKTVTASRDLDSQLTGLLTRYLSIMAVIRMMTNLFRNMVSYVSDYSNKMSEIQMITLKSSSEIGKLADEYRELAAEMRVSSLEMADAAIYFTRQGLGAEEIETRLKNVTMYAKAANVEFKDASEIITAVINSMGLVEQEAEDGRNAAQRVADVFLNIGDHAATSGQEIGEAMQKAAASAGAFGVSMEWLASYIATVSETTRQEARTIGTAFNTIIARLHQIKQTGYNQEDETKVNDIAKALSKIDVVLMDQAGNWRDMEVILQEIAAKWGDLDGKTRSYIATTMAGVKQQNVFLALMNDMSKGIEGNSRAFELYNLAMESAGTASEKYDVYLDSVAASQEKLNIAQEQFYALLSQDVIKGWNSALATFVNMVVHGSEALNGWNIILPLIIGGITGIGVVIHTVNAGLMETITLTSVLEKHPIMMAISAAIVVAGGLVAVLSAIGEATQASAKRFEDAKKAIEEYSNKISKAESSQQSLADLQLEIEENTELTSDELRKYSGLLDSLEGISLRAKAAVMELKSGFGDQREQVAILNEELEKYIENQHKLAISEGVKKYKNYKKDNDTYDLASKWFDFSNVITDRESFTEALKYMYGRATNQGSGLASWADGILGSINYDWSDASRYFPQKLIEEIKEMRKNSSAPDADATWEEIANIIWMSYFPGDASYNIGAYLSDEINTAVDDAMDMIGYNLNPIDFGLVRKKLMDRIYGDDGILSKDEYGGFSQTIASFMAEFLSNGLDPESFDISIGERISAYIQDLWTRMGEEINDEMLAGIALVFNNDPEFAQEFSDAIAEMVEAGFDDEAIFERLFDTPFEQWNQIIEKLREDMESSMVEILGDTDEMLSSMMNDMSLKELKDFNDLINKLYDNDVNTEQINAVIAGASSYKEMMEQLSKLTPEELTQSNEEATVSLTELSKAITNSIKDIRALDKAIKDIEKNGANFDMSEMLALAQTHGEIWTVINDEEALLAVLKQIKAEAESGQRETIESFILNDPNAMRGSRYYNQNEEFETLGKYRESLTDPEEIAAFDAEIAGLVDIWVTANENMQAEAQETAKSFKDLVSEVEKFDKVIQKLENGKAIDFSDIIDLSTAHPELVAFANDEEMLIEQLKRLRSEAQENVRQSIEDTVLDSEEYMKANFAQFYGEGTETVRKFIAVLDESGVAHEQIDEKVRADTEAIVKLSNATANATEETGTATKSFQDMVKEVEKIDKVIKKIESNKAIDFSDIIDLSTAHPEIVAFASDADKLLDILRKIKAESKEGIRAELEKSVLGNEDWFSIWKRENNVTSGATKASDYMASLSPETSQQDAEAYTAISNAVKDATGNLVDLSDTLLATGESTDTATKAFNSAVREVETFDKTIKDLRDKGVVDFSDIINLSAAHPDIVAFANDEEQLLAYLQELREQAKQNVLDTVKDAMLDSKKYLQAAYPELAEEYETMRDYLNSLDEGSEEYISISAEMDEAAGKIADAATRTEEAAATWLQTQALIAERDMEVNWAKSNHFENQIGQLQGALETDGMEAAVALFNSWSDEMKKAVATEYPAFIVELGKAETKILDQGEATADLTQETENLTRALDIATKVNNVKYFKDSAKAIKDLSDGTISATDAYDIYTKEVNQVTKAYEDILDVQNKMAYNAKAVNRDNQQSIDAGDVSNLAAVLNMTTDEVLADFPAAVDMFNELTSSAGELADMLNLLNDVAFIRITGTSDADFSAMEAGLISVKNLADDAVEKLKATGQWTTETIDLPQTAMIWNPGENGGGFWSSETVSAGATVLKPTGANLFQGASSVARKRDTSQKKSSGKSGGGGGGGSKNDDFRDKNVTTEVEKMLDMMKQVMQLQQFTQNYYQAQQKYYAATGQIQGVINYMQLEKKAIQDQNKSLKENIKSIEEHMNAKKAELASLSTSDERYAEVADDLDKLQKAHQEYTLQLINNKTALVNLNKAIKEQQDKIRQMEIDLENLILQAIKDREELKQQKLEAEINMENKIMDVLRRRYELERDKILETTNLKIESLKQERDLLDEQLRMRKEQAEEEDKLVKLRELEAQYQRIISDPTRAKEAQKIRDDINKLREELAWDTAEKEVKAQQDSIDQQITSLEEYVEYIENYYEELFENPQRLIEEMQEIMKMSHEAILAWLQQNDEEYLKATSNMQQKMTQEWDQTLNDMEGIIKTYWDEVYQIIEQGDEAIIDFLKENSKEYKEASKKQGQAFVDEWKKKLEDLRKAHENVVAKILKEYEKIPQGVNGGDTGGNNNGGGGGGGTHYKFKYNGKEYKGYTSEEKAKEAISKLAKQERDDAGKNYGNSPTLYDYYYNLANQNEKDAIKSIARYAKGGLATFTGPAWLDGSKQNPERILSPYQTKLFETMVKALEAISTIPVMSMPNMDGLNSTGGSTISVGDIIVNVDNLDTDDDYAELARKVGEVLMDEIGKTAVIGGLHIRSN